MKIASIILCKSHRIIDEFSEPDFKFCHSLLSQIFSKLIPKSRKSIERNIFEAPKWQNEYCQFVFQNHKIVFATIRLDQAWEMLRIFPRDMLKKINNKLKKKFELKNTQHIFHSNLQIFDLIVENQRFQYRAKTSDLYSFFIKTKILIL